MVRIQRRFSRKRYLGGKYVYKYERFSLGIPRKYHDAVRRFLGCDLDMDLTVKGSYLVITLAVAKTFLPAENTPANLGSERLLEAEF